MVEKKKYEIYKKLNLGLNLGQRLVYAVALDGNSIDISHCVVRCVLTKMVIWAILVIGYTVYGDSNREFEKLSH